MSNYTKLCLVFISMLAFAFFASCVSSGTTENNPVEDSAEFKVHDPPVFMLESTKKIPSDAISKQGTQYDFINAYHYDESFGLFAFGHKNRTGRAIPADSKSNSGINEEPGEPYIEAKPPTVTFVGDILLDRGTKDLYASKGFVGLFLDDGRLGSTDILMANLEFPFSNRGEPQDKTWVFRCNPKHIGFLSDMGIGVVSLGNNHSLDYGRDALLDTLDLLDLNDIAYVGAGRNLDDASNFRIFEVNGRKIAFLGASRVVPYVSWYAQKNRPGVFTTYDPAPLLERIRIASVEADYVVVYVHWGVEKESHPEGWQRTLAKRYIDAGASCVVGSHPHVLQGIEFYEGIPIIYSLGNFIWPDASKDTMTLDITFGDEIIVAVNPYTIKNLKTTIADGKDRERILEHLRDISFYVEIGGDGLVRQKQ